MAWITFLASAATAIPASGLGAPLTSEGTTLLDFEADLQSHLGNRTDLTSTELRKLINQAYIDFATSLRLAELQGSLTFSLAAGQPLYLLPDEVFSVEALSAVNSGDTYPDYGGRRLEQIGLLDYRGLPEYAAEVPVKYYKRGQLLVVYPTPSTVFPIRVDFRIRPDSMTADTHSPILPLEWHEGILLSARAKGHRKLLEFTAAREAEADVADFIRRRTDSAVEDERHRRVGTQPLGYKNLGGRHHLIRKPFAEGEW